MPVSARNGGTEPAAAAAAWMRANGGAFEDQEVVDGYLHRPPYAPQLFARLLALAPGRERALDLGSGPGIFAAELAPHFRVVEAVDPSAAMLALGRRVFPAPNIQWRRHSAEAFSPARYDLAVVGMALHWMRREVVFPKLVQALGRVGRLAVIDGNSPVAPPWAQAWSEFLSRWMASVGTTYDGAAFEAEMQSYRPWLDVEGDEAFEFDFVQPLDAFVACQRSRSAWSRSRLGGDADRLGRELHALLSPYATDGALSYRIRSHMVWGRPRAAPFAS
jgi:SAM-dependent methyltransferase